MRERMDKKNREGTVVAVGLIRSLACQIVSENELNTRIGTKSQRIQQKYQERNERNEKFEKR